MSVILIGFMGAGKSTVARLLSADFIDLDKLIERQIEMPIARFFELFGEQDFRQLENEVFESSIQMDFVIATGGGIVESEKNREVLQFQSQVIYLQADFETLWMRIDADKENVRPLASDKTAAQALFEKRAPLYEKFADFVVNVAEKSPMEIVEEIRKWKESR